MWNGVSKYIFYGRAGEISSNHEKAQTLSVISLHLLQLSMVYINTLMIQQIIEEQRLSDVLTKEDKRALTPLIYEHVNPMGCFQYICQSVYLTLFIRRLRNGENFSKKNGKKSFFFT